MEFHQLAYRKMVYHNLKYSSNEVVGVFIGRRTNDVLSIVDAFPLFHNPVTAPMLELAFVMVRFVLLNKFCSLLICRLINNTCNRKICLSLVFIVRMINKLPMEVLFKLQTKWRITLNAAFYLR
jgi:hypothetical protein